MKVPPKTDISKNQGEPSVIRDPNQSFWSWWKPAGWGIKAALFPLPVFFFGILILWLADISTAYESTAVLFLSNIAFTFLASLLICWMAGCAFLASGQAHLIMLGCGALTWGVGNVMASALFARDPNLAITIHNLGALCAAAFHLVGITLRWPIEIQPNNRGFWLALGYPGGLLPISIISVMAVTQQTPAFFVPGAGGTPIRQIVLASSILCFMASSWMVLKLLQKKRSVFLYWYALALALLAIGLLGVMLQRVSGGPLGWAGRVAQLLGAIYLLASAFWAYREFGGWRFLVNTAEGTGSATPNKARLFRLAVRYGTAAIMVGIAYGFRLVLTTSVGPGLPVYITFFPAVMVAAMLAGFGPGLLAAFLSALILWEGSPHLIGSASFDSPAERLGLLLFLGICAFLSLVAELYRQSQRKAAAYDRSSALRASEERFRRLVEVSSEIVWVTDDQTQPKEDSPSWRAYTGDTLENWLAGGWLKRVHPDDQSAAASLWREAASSNRPYSMEFRLLHHSGQYRRMQCRAVPILNPDGSIREWIGMSTDVTEFKAAEQALQNREQQLRIITDAIPALISYIGRDQRYHFVNRQYEVWFGQHPGDLLGKTMTEVLGAKAMEQLAPFVDRVLKGEDIRFEVEAHYPRHNTRWIDAHYVPDANAQGQISGFFVLVQDITTRRRLQEALRQSESFLRSILDNLAAFVGVLTPDGTVVQINRAPLEAAGLQRGDVVGKKFWECHWWTHSHKLQLELEAACERALQGEIVRFDAEIRLADNQTMFIDCQIAPLRNDSGQITYLIPSAVDITRRREAEASLRSSEEQFRKIYEHAATGIVITSLEGLLEGCNPAYETITGYTESELRGMSLAGLVHPEDRESYNRLIRQLLAGEVPHFQNENRYYRKDGAIVWVQTSISTLRDADGLPAHIIGLARDITEAKASRDLLRESEARLRIAKSAAQLGIFDHDLPTGALTCDERAGELLEAKGASTMEQLLAGLDPMDRVLAKDAMQTALAPDSGGTFSFECRIPTPQGTTRWLASTGQVLFSHAKPVRLVGTVQDITQRREFQVELERLVAERTSKLQELVGDLEHFSYSITHDMRAPLRAMKGYGEVLVELCPECPNPQRKTFLQRIMAAADRMDCLIVDALNYSRAVRQELPLSPVDPGRLIRGMLDSYPEFQTDRADIQIIGELPPVLANEAGLTQCFSNLLGNAVKFVRPGKRAKVRISSETVSDTIRIWIEDNGIGIPETMISKVFDMFSRGQTTHEGTGIGLALVRKVVHRMGGKVGVESEVGKGSRFWVELLAAPDRGSERGRC